MPHVFFQDFGFPQSQEETITEDQKKFIYNCLVIELSNNWPFVRWMMDKYRNGYLKRVDPLEKDWFDFIQSQHIDVEKYGKDNQRFLQEYIKR